MPKGYVPPDLVKASQAGIPGGGQVRAVMIDDLRAMTDAAALADAAIGVQSAYRSFESQQTVFAGWVARLGYSQALKVSARPGHSEHQLGLAIDFRSEPGGSSLTGAFATTPAGKWMKAHAWEYGFVMSYPRGSIDLTCYAFEPWHFRYVGRDLAALIHGSGLTPREYLWANFTTTIVPPAPKPTTAPAKTATPTATPEPTQTLAPSPSPAPATVPPTATPVPPTAAPLAPTAEPAPLVTPAPGDDGDVAALAPVVVGGAVGVLGLLAVGAWLGLRRGRSGVGLSD